MDGKERGVTPLTLSDVPVGIRRVVIESSAGTVRRDVRVVANSQVTINESIISGWIATFAPFELQIYEGTRLLGTTESGRIMARPGRHDLDFVNTRLGFRERRGVDVNPGTTTAVNIASIVGIVRITAPAGADVLIDGALFGDTPIRELSRRSHALNSPAIRSWGAGVVTVARPHHGVSSIQQTMTWSWSSGVASRSSSADTTSSCIVGAAHSSS